MTELYHAALRTVGLLLIIAISMCHPSCGMAETVVVRDVRTGSDDDYVRLVLETDRLLAPPPVVAITDNRLHISLAGAVEVPRALLSKAYGRDIIRLDTHPSSGATRIEAVLTFVPAEIKTFALSEPHRFVIDAYRPRASPTAGAPSEGTPRPIALIDLAPHGPSSAPADAATALQSRPATGVDATGVAADGSARNRFQQRLLVILIVVTSILLVAIIVMMCTGKYR